MAPKDDLSETKKLMGALVRMKPKPHDEMKNKKPAPKVRKKRVSKSAR
jgi:hypothetical protein